MDVAGAVEQEEARAGEGVAGGTRGDVGNADVVVRGADVGDELKLLREGMGSGRGGAGGGEGETTEDRRSRDWNSDQECHRRHARSIPVLPVALSQSYENTYFLYNICTI